MQTTRSVSLPNRNGNGKKVTNLVSHGTDGRCGRSNKGDALLLASLSKDGVLTQESIAWMDSLCASGLACLNDLVNDEVALIDWSRALLCAPV